MALAYSDVALVYCRPARATTYTMAPYPHGHYGIMFQTTMSLLPTPPWTRMTRLTQYPVAKHQFGKQKS